MVHKFGEQMRRKYHDTTIQKLSKIGNSTQFPKKTSRAVKPKPAGCTGPGRKKASCHIPEKPLPYCKGTSVQSARQACRPVERSFTGVKRDSRNFVPPQYQLNPPTLRKDTVFQVPQGISQEVMWNLFKTDVVPITNFPFMTHLRSEFSLFEHSEYLQRRNERLDQEKEKLWQLSWKENIDGLLDDNSFDRDRMALKQNERLYTALKKKLDDHPVSKNSTRKLRCRPIRLVEPFAEEAAIYYRNLEKLPEEPKEKFVIPLTSMMTEETDLPYPPGTRVKSQFYSRIPQTSIESRKPKPIPRTPSLTYQLFLLPEDEGPMLHQANKLNHQVDKVAEKHNGQIPTEEDHLYPDIVNILDLEDGDYGVGHRHTSSEQAPSESEHTAEDEDEEEDEELPADIIDPVETFFDKSKEIVMTMKRKAFAADESLKARLMDLRMNRGSPDLL